MKQKTEKCNSADGRLPNGERVYLVYWDFLDSLSEFVGLEHNDRSDGRALDEGNRHEPGQLQVGVHVYDQPTQLWSATGKESEL